MILHEMKFNFHVKLLNCSLRFSLFLLGFQVNFKYHQGCIALSCVQVFRDAQVNFAQQQGLIHHLASPRLQVAAGCSVTNLSAFASKSYQCMVYGKLTHDPV